MSSGIGHVFCFMCCTSTWSAHPSCCILLVRKLPHPCSISARAASSLNGHSSKIAFFRHENQARLARWSAFTVVKYLLGLPGPSLSLYFPIFTLSLNSASYCSITDQMFTVHPVPHIIGKYFLSLNPISEMPIHSIFHSMTTSALTRTSVISIYKIHLAVRNRILYLVKLLCMHQ